MNDTQPRPLARTTFDLAYLDQSPTHRGGIERIDEEGIFGWCVAAARPSSRVEIGIFCCGLLIATTRTLRERPDISLVVKDATASGFEFRWLELTEQKRDSLIEALKVMDATAPVPISLRVTGAAAELDPSLAEKSGIPNCGRTLKALGSFARRPAISPIAEREALLATLPAPRTPPGESRVRAIAFYLPQFHPIPENDEWWGKGFTEWTNVSAANPVFVGHDQPRFPSELGYYDLRTPGVIEAQIELAKTHGLAGFCFHHYWFGGQRLLQYPLQRFLEIDHDFGFCICWANEPWSRRWDGSEHEVLMPQPHSVESDTQFIRDTLPILQDRRYIRVDGKPLLIVYRLGLFKEPNVVFERWRQICVANGLSGLHICMAETFGARNPWQYGCDSAVEFPPHAVKARNLIENANAIDGLNPGFKGQIYEYTEVVANQVAMPTPEYPRYQTVMLGWDNTSRRGLNGHIFRGFTLGAFETWLEHACQTTERDFSGDARIIFINAWNEWGEGTYLEPDRRHGRQYLLAVKRILTGGEATDATFRVLRQRLAHDASALAALDRIESRQITLERTLAYAVENGRPRSAFLTRSALSTREPPGCESRRPGGQGHIDNIGIRDGANRRMARRGEVVHVTGWASPGDRTLTHQSIAYVKLTQSYRDAQPHFAAILHRSQREDVVRHFVNAPSPLPAAEDPRAPRLARIFAFIRADRQTAAAEPPPRITGEHLLWSGFATTFSTEHLLPGRYNLSILFPVLTSAHRGAVDVLLDATLEIVE